MKISFITCVNDESEYSECLFYLNRLLIPDNCSLEIVPIRNAESMASGYNIGMSKNPNDINVFLHQDTYIINKCFIQDIIHIFESDERIGVIGCTGNSDIMSRTYMNYNVGKVYHHGSPMLLDYENDDKDYQPVDIVDGFILASRYSIPFLENVFDGWDFYDVSICTEYKRHGYQVVVAGQKEEPWCYHANTFSNMTNYYKYEERFINTYFPDKVYEFTDNKSKSLSYSDMQNKTLSIIKGQIDIGNKEELYTLFQSKDFRGHGFLKELEAIVDIDYLEQNSDSKNNLWTKGDNSIDLIEKIRNLRRSLKRIEYMATDSFDDIIKDITSVYSVFAVIEIFDKYIYKKEFVYALLYKYYRENSFSDLMVLEKIR